jgi:hypothetical protein
MADDTNTAGLKALQEYLKDCDAHAIVPDVGGAWHAAFQAGRASLAASAASAGSEPVAVAEVSCTHVHGWGTRWIVDADRKLNIPPLGTKLYARPPAPKQGQKDSSRLRKALIRAQQAINSMKVEAETAAQGDKRMMLEACETISNEGLQADMAIRGVLANHPSPPEGAPAGATVLCWVNEDELPEGLTQEAYSALFPHSRVDMVRMFPVFGPTAQAAPAGAGTWAHLKLMMEESAWDGTLQLSDALANIDDFVEAHPSPPEGMAGRLQVYRCKIKSRKQIDKEIHREQQGWWADVAAGQKLLLRQAVQSDIDRCNLGEKRSRNPDDYMCETHTNGSLVPKIALEYMNPEENVFAAAPPLPAYEAKEL